VPVALFRRFGKERKDERMHKYRNAEADKMTTLLFVRYVPG
jgi:hypothetical protein